MERHDADLTNDAAILVVPRRGCFKDSLELVVSPWSSSHELMSERTVDLDTEDCFHSSDVCPL